MLSMLSRVVKCLVVIGGVAWFTMLAGAVPQPGHAPQVILDQPPKAGEDISGLTDTEALVLAASGAKGYIVHVGRDDNAFIADLTVPATKGGQCALGVLKGPRGSHAVGYDEAGTRLWVGNFPEGSVSVVDVSQPLTEKCVVTGTVAINDSATDVVYDAASQRAYVSGLMTNSVYVLGLTAGGQYALQATVDLSEVCLGPNAMALGAGALYVACMFSNSIARVSLAPLQLSSAVNVASTPVDIKIAQDGKLYVAAAGSDAVAVVDSTQMKLAALIKLVGLQTSELNPRYVALSPDEKLVYVSNAADQSVSVMCRDIFYVAAAFRAIAKTRITMPGVIATVDHAGKHLLYVADKGGLLQVFDAGEFYGLCP